MKLAHRIEILWCFGPYELSDLAEHTYEDDKDDKDEDDEDV